MAEDSFPSNYLYNQTSRPQARPDVNPGLHDQKTWIDYLEDHKPLFITIMVLVSVTGTTLAIYLTYRCCKATNRKHERYAERKSERARQRAEIIKDRNNIAEVTKERDEIQKKYEELQVKHEDTDHQLSDLRIEHQDMRMKMDHLTYQLARMRRECQRLQLDQDRTTDSHLLQRGVAERHSFAAQVAPIKDAIANEIAAAARLKLNPAPVRPPPPIPDLPQCEEIPMKTFDT